MAYERIVDKKREQLNIDRKKEGIEILNGEKIKIDASGGSGFIPLNTKAFTVNLTVSTLDAMAFRMPVSFQNEVRN